MIVLVDTMNVIFIEFHVACKLLKDEGKTLDEENLPFYAHLLFNKLNNFFSTYGNIIFCWEGYHSLDWRRSIYPDYKRNREGMKSQDEFKVLKSFLPKIEEVLNYYPCKQIRVDEAEADDVIYSLAKKYSAIDDVIIISTDGDLVQIRNSFVNEVEIYNPIRRSFAKENKFLIEEKAICGDRSDNIPGLYRVGVKTFEKMISDATMYKKIMDKGDNREIYKRFKIIIDLSQFPKNFQQKMVKSGSERIKMSIQQRYSTVGTVLIIRNESERRFI